VAFSISERASLFEQAVEARRGELLFRGENYFAFCKNYKRNSVPEASGRSWNDVVFWFPLKFGESFADWYAIC